MQVMGHKKDKSCANNIIGRFIFSCFVFLCFHLSECSCVHVSEYLNERAGGNRGG